MSVDPEMTLNGSSPSGRCVRLAAALRWLQQVLEEEETVQGQTDSRDTAPLTASTGLPSRDITQLLSGLTALVLSGLEQTDGALAALRCNHNALALSPERLVATLGAPAKRVMRMLSSFLLAQGQSTLVAAQLMSPKPMNHVGAHLVYGRILGKGAFGSVVESYNRLDGRYSAVKQISFHSVCPWWVPLEQIELRHARILREVRMLASMTRSPYIVQYYWCWLEPQAEPAASPHGSAVLRAAPPAAVSVPLGRTASAPIPSATPLLQVIDSVDRANAPASASSAEDSESGTASTSTSRPSSTGSKAIIVTSHASKPARFTYTLNIAMELCRGRSLHEWIQKQRRVDHQTNTSILYQLLLGLRHVHSQGIIHRDIKPANIFLDWSGNHPSVKIGDFGLATLTSFTSSDSTGSPTPMFPLARVRSFDTENSGEHTAEVGTASYCAPEQLAGNVYDHRVDIYAVGIIVIELFVPFSTAMERAVTLRAARAGTLPDVLTQNHAMVAALVQRLLCPSPAGRPTADELLEHYALLFSAHNTGNASAHDVAGRRRPQMDGPRSPGALRRPGLFKPHRLVDDADGDKSTTAAAASAATAGEGSFRLAAASSWPRCRVELLSELSELPELSTGSLAESPNSREQTNEPAWSDAQYMDRFHQQPSAESSAAGTTVLLAAPPHVLARKDATAEVSDHHHGAGDQSGVLERSGKDPLRFPSKPMWVVELQRKLAEKEKEMGRLRKSLGQLEAESKLLTAKLRGWEGYSGEPNLHGEAG